VPAETSISRVERIVVEQRGDVAGAAGARDAVRDQCRASFSSSGSSGEPVVYTVGKVAP